MHSDEHRPYVSTYSEYLTHWVVEIAQVLIMESLEMVLQRNVQHRMTPFFMRF